MTEAYIKVHVKVEPAFIINGSKYRIYDKDSRFSYRPDKKLEITRGYKLTHDNGYVEFMTKDEYFDSVILEIGKGNV